MKIPHCPLYAGQFVYVVDIFFFVGLFKQLFNDVPDAFFGFHFVYCVAVPDL